MTGLLAAIVFILFAAVMTTYIVSRKMYLWLPGYLRCEFGRCWMRKRRDGPTHVLFLMVDHFEPTKKSNVEPWLERFPALARKYVDADGRCFQYSWFFPVEQYSVNGSFVEDVAGLCRMGLGEIEIHLHHAGDDATRLRERLEEGLGAMQGHGVARTVDGKTAFGFIHGNWALDNSIPSHCGVRDELSILDSLGCFCDFTFPALGTLAQPRMVNSIYYAKSDAKRNKAYDSGKPVIAGGPASPGLMLLPGPVSLRWGRRWGLVFPKGEGGTVQFNDLPTEDRVDSWVRNGAHVKGKPDWVFVKVHTHGASPKNWEILLGGGLELVLKRLTSVYNDGIKYSLHFVTAREAYNIVKAAEEGEVGDPGKYRDYLVGRYSV